MLRILFICVTCIFLLCGVSECELTLFVRKLNNTRYKFACVASGDTLKSAITWLPKNVGRDVYSHSKQKNSTVQLRSMKFVGSSLNFYLPPVLDSRWESLSATMVKGKTQIGIRTKQDLSTINISILFRKWFTVILRTNSTSICATISEMHRQNEKDLKYTFSECQQESFNYSFEELGYATWMHFTIYKKNGNFYLSEFKEEENYEKFVVNSFEVSSPIGQVKIHEYPIFSGRPPGNSLCFSFYVLTSGACAGLVGSKRKEWIQLKSTDKNVSIDIIESCFFSDIRYCSKNSETRLDLESNDTKVACVTLGEAKQSVFYDLPVKYTTKLKSSSRAYLGNNYVTCNLNGDCFCTKGKTGHFCETGLNKVKNLTVSMHSANSVLIRWKPPDLLNNEEVDQYKVEYIRNDIYESSDTYNCILWDDYICTELKNLIKNISYNISVSSKIKGVEGFGLPENCSIITLETLPEHPKNISAKIMNCSLILNWKHPDRVNGQLTRFVITILGTKKNYTESLNVTKYQRTYTYMIRNITFGHYNIFIQSENSIGLSSIDKMHEIYVNSCTMNTEQNQLLEWLETNIFYVYIIGAAFGTLLLCICCWITYSYRNSCRCNKSNITEVEDSIPLYQCKNVIIKRDDVSNVLKLWVDNNVDDAHILNEFTDVNKKNHYLYNTLLTKDPCRVKVKDVINDTEANAHFIQGCKGDKTYIAMQCPKNKNMTEAFWMVVWDEKVSIIVSLLTKNELEEKSYDYSFSNNWNAIKVKLIFTRCYCDFLIRTFTITRLGDTRKVLQFNYFTWPHDGIPVNPLSFVDYLKCVKSHDVETTPILVHCSEGFGRTGTYIMCDYFMNSADAVLNVSRYLEVIIKCRPYLVKTYSQYKFVYFVIDELNVNRQTRVDSATFLSRCTEMMETNLPADNAYIKKRRYIYKLLYSDEDRTNFASNWTIVPGFQNENTYYVTKQPHFDDVHLFWEFIYSEKIRNVLILQNLHDDSEKFWPSQDIPLQFEKLEINMMKYSRDKTLKIYRVEVHKENEDSLEVVLLHFKDWDVNLKVPGNLKEFYEFYKMYNHIKSPRDNKTVVCCHNGATASGLFICFDLLLQKWKSEDVFDLVWAVLSIKHRQEYFMEKLEQHRFLYKLFEYYLTDVENYTTYNEYSSISQTFPAGYDLINETPFL